jgi:hypothetical protein
LGRDGLKEPAVDDTATIVLTTVKLSRARQQAATTGGVMRVAWIVAFHCLISKARERSGVLEKEVRCNGSAE